jgi:hypothetical protein
VGGSSVMDEASSGTTRSIMLTTGSSPIAMSSSLIDIWPVNSPVCSSPISRRYALLAAQAGKDTQQPDAAPAGHWFAAPGPDAPMKAVRRIRGASEGMRSGPGTSEVTVRGYHQLQGLHQSAIRTL